MPIAASSRPSSENPMATTVTNPTMNPLTPSRESAAAQASRVPVLALKGIRKNFGSFPALRGVDLDLYAGECLGLIGDNAAGKSTLTKVMAGTYLPDDGAIYMEGEEVRLTGPAEARARHIEMVYQDLSLCDTVDVAGNLFLGREICKGGMLQRKRMLTEARALLERLKIRIPNLSNTVEQLSGGQRQSI